MIGAARRYALAFADQGLTALLSLIVALWLIRRGTEEAFGVWVFWSSTALVAGTVVAAMTSVHLHRLPSAPAGRRGTERAILSAVLGLAAAAALGSAIAVLLLRGPLSVPEAVLFVPGTVLGLHARVLAASRGALGWAAWVSAAVFAAVVAGLAIGEATGFGVTAGEVLALNGLAQALAGGWALRRLSAGAGPDFGASGRRRWRVLLRRSPWPLAGGLAGEVSMRLYVFLVPAMAGTAALGAVAAAQTLLRPATLLAGAWAAAARVPLASSRGRGDERGFLRLVSVGAFGPAMATLVLGAAVATGWPLVSRTLYGGRFPGEEVAVLLWTAAMAVACLTFAGTTAAQSLGRLRASARADLAGATVCAAAMPVLLLALPPAAAVGAMALGGTVQAAMQWRSLRGAVPSRRT